jgi:hypothetical protein
MKSWNYDQEEPNQERLIRLEPLEYAVGDL